MWGASDPRQRVYGRLFGCNAGAGNLMFTASPYPRSAAELEALRALNGALADSIAGRLKRLSEDR